MTEPQVIEDNLTKELRREFKRLSTPQTNCLVKILNVLRAAYDSPEEHRKATNKALLLLVDSVDSKTFRHFLDFLNHHLSPSKARLRWYLTFHQRALFKKLQEIITKHHTPIDNPSTFVQLRTQLKPTNDGKSDSLNSLNRALMNLFSSLMSNQYGKKITTRGGKCLGTWNYGAA